AVLIEGLYNASDVRHLLTNSYVDAVNRVSTAGLVGVALVNDGVDTDLGFTSLSVTDNEFSLSSTNWDHCVNRFDTGLKRFLNGLTIYNARGHDFQSSVSFNSDWSETIEGLTEGV